MEAIGGTTAQRQLVLADSIFSNEKYRRQGFQRIRASATRYYSAGTSKLVKVHFEASSDGVRRAGE